MKAEHKPNVFVDAGASDGGTIRRFRELYPDASQYEIHAFEPNPIWPEIPNVQFHRKAVWIGDGLVDLYCGEPESATLMRTKTTGNIDYQNPLTIPAIDFGRWLCRFDRRSVVLKMDIEGAEYAVLDRMILTGAIHTVRELHIDWHWNKIGMTEKFHTVYLDRLSRYGFKVYDLSRSRPEFLEDYP